MMWDRLLIAVGSTALLTLMAGCEGPQGPGGEDASGVDLVPPTIKLLSPDPLATVWGVIPLSARAIDNAAVHHVTFFVDGSPQVGDTVLVVRESPYEFEVNAASLTRGWHYISARAYDLAGNVNDTPPIAVMLGFKEDLSDTIITQRYHSGVLRDSLKLPDPQHATQAYWTRFDRVDDCLVAAVKVWLGAMFTDSSATVVQVSYAEGRGIPETVLDLVSLDRDELTGAMREYRLALGDDTLSGDKDLFIVVSTINRAREDTLLVGLDGGMPPRNRSGSRDEDGVFEISQRFGTRGNLMMECSLYYPRREQQ